MKKVFPFLFVILSFSLIAQEDTYQSLIVKRIADYTTAIRLDPNDAVAYAKRGNAYGNLGKYNTAISDYTTAIRLDPNDASAYFNRGLLYDDVKYELRDRKSAIADYTTAIRLSPDWFTLYYKRGIAYAYLGEYISAISDFTAAIILNPEKVGSEVTEHDIFVNFINADTFRARGNAYIVLGEYNAAIADFTTAIRLGTVKQRKWSYHHRGRAKEKAGLPYCSDYKRACEYGKCDLYNRKCR